MVSIFFPEKSAVYEIMWKTGRARQAADNNIIWCVRISCWIPKVTNAKSEYAIYIAFKLYQWFLERASILLLYFHRLSCLILKKALFSPSCRI